MGPSSDLMKSIVSMGERTRIFSFSIVSASKSSMSRMPVYVRFAKLSVYNDNLLAQCCVSNPVDIPSGVPCVFPEWLEEYVCKSG